MTNLSETFGGGGYANGFNSASPAPNLFTVALAAGQGTLAPFTVLAKNGDGEYIVLGSDAYHGTDVAIDSTSHKATVSNKPGLNTATLKCYADGEELDPDDYTVSYSSGTLEITFTDTDLTKADIYCATELIPSGVLAKEAATGATSGNAVISAGYRFGAFNRNHLIYADGYIWTDFDEDAMRDMGYALADSLS